MKICGEHKLDFKGTLTLRKCYAFLSKRRFARVAAKKVGSERSWAIVASGQRGSHFHQYHRGPGAHPVARRRFFALPVAARVA
jgi:hypothetical protein